MAAAKQQCFLRFLYWTESSLSSFKVRGLQMTINLALGHIFKVGTPKRVDLLHFRFMIDI